MPQAIDLRARLRFSTNNETPPRARVYLGEGLGVYIDITTAAGAPTAASGVRLLCRRPDGLALVFTSEALGLDGVGSYFAEVSFDQAGTWYLRGECIGSRPAVDEAKVTVVGTFAMVSKMPSPLLVTEDLSPILIQEGGLMTVARVTSLPEATALEGLDLVGAQDGQGKHVAWETLRAAAADVGGGSGAEAGAAAGAIAGEAAGAAIAGQAAADAIAPQVASINEQVAAVSANVLLTAADRAAVADDRTAADLARAGAEQALSQAGTAVGEADAARIGAQSALGQASGFASTASLAATAALAATTLYADTTAGLAAVIEGAYFSVPGAGSAYATLYRKTGGAAVLINSYPSKQALDDATAGLVGVDDRLATKQSALQMAAPEGMADWVGPVAGTEVLFGANLADENRFVGKNIEAMTAVRWPSFIDYLGQGHTHYRLNASGQVLGYTDEAGVDWRWDGAAYVRAAPFGGGAAGITSVNGDAGPAVSITSVETAQQFPGFVDYLGLGYRHYQINSAGQLLGYTDAAGKAYTWNGTAYAAAVRATAADVGLGAVANTGPVNLPLTTAWRETTWRAATGPLAVPTRPAEAQLPALISFDAAAYGSYVCQQIPSIDVLGRRMWRAEYGSNTVEPGGNGEEVPCFVRLSRAPLTGAGKLLAWEKVAFIVPPTLSQGVLDPHIVATPDDRLLIVFPVGGSGRRTVFGCVLQNPLTGGPGNWQFGPVCFIGWGFVGKPRMNGGELIVTTNEPIPSSGAIADYQGSKYIKLSIDAAGVINTETISTIPPPVDQSQSSFQETSVMVFGRGGRMATFRTGAGQNVVRSLDAGETWGTPTLFQPGGFGTISSRTDLVRSPSGRAVYAFNNSPPGGARARMAVTLSDVDGLPDGVPASWPYLFTFDPRGAQEPRVSYASVAFGRLRDGSYDGKIYVAYDRGRGNAIDPLTGTWCNELIVAEMDEEAIVAGNPTVQLYTVTTGA